MSDQSSSEENEVEYIMSTRQHRSNAGNRMKRLLEEEIKGMQSKTENMDEDEIDLLFREDDEDDEFEYNSDEIEEDGENQDEEEEEEEEEIKSSEKEKIVEKTAIRSTGSENDLQESNNEENVDEDLMLTESEDESSGNEENDAGEKELQRQERLKLKQKRQRSKKAPIIRRRADDADLTNDEEEKNKKRRKKYVTQLNAESLLQTERRTSKRSSVIENKMKVYEKLSKAEQKRKALQKRMEKNREKSQEIVLTQEMRLNLAKETEELNLKSLNKYKEQEIHKKQSRLALQQRQKQKFKNGEVIIQLYSSEHFVTPIQEIEDRSYWEEEVKKREKKEKKTKRKYTKRKHKQDTIESKSEKEDQLINKDSFQTVTPTIAEDESSEKNLEEPEPRTNIPNSTVPLFSIESKENIVTENTIKDTLNPNLENNSENDHNIVESPSADNNNVTVSKENIHENENIEKLSTPLTDSEIVSGSDVGTENLMLSMGNSDDSSRTHTIEFESVNEKDIVTKSEDLESSKESANVEKQVSFADEVAIKVIDNNIPVITTDNNSDGLENSMDEASEKLEDTSDITDIEDALIYEGPFQLVGKNLITVYKYPDEQLKSPTNELLFGHDLNSKTIQHLDEMERICHLTASKEITNSDNRVSIIPDLSFLNTYPSFGEYDKKIVIDTSTETNNDKEIEINTTPPTGVLLSNGVRKKCLLTHKGCQYFDPKNGVPYSDVDSYKIIQELQDPIGASGSEGDPHPRFYWYGFANGGIYLDMNQRHAKGVPEGFA